MASVGYKYKIYTYIGIMPKAVAHLCQQTGLMISHVRLLLWCIAIAGYQLSSNKSNSQQQPTAGYLSKSLSGASLPTRVKTTTSRIRICVTIQVW